MTAAIQGILLAPSLLLSVVGLAAMSIDEYAGWALLFALGSASIVLDLGAFQLAQIHRSQGPMRGTDLARLYAQASVAPLLLTAATTIFWDGFRDAFVDGSGVASRALPLILGGAALVRSWQNVSNGLALGARAERTRARAAASGAVVQIVLLPIAVVVPAVYGLSLVYLVGGLVGLVGLAGVVRGSAGGEAARGAGQVRTRATIGLLSVSLTQVDRLVVAALVSSEGLAAYDFASRLVGTVKLGCVLLATGATAQGARRASADDAEAIAYLAHAQRFLDRLAAAAFAAAPVGVLVLTAVAKPELVQTATGVAVILSVGHGVHATTAVLTGYLSGMRRLGPELTYLTISIVGMLVTAWPLGHVLGTYGVAASVGLSLLVGAAWLRRSAPRSAGLTGV